MKKGLKAPEEALAGATDFLHFFGHVARGLVWARMAQAAADALGAGAEDRGIYEAKLATARFYMARVLPETGLRRWRIESGSTPVMSLPADAF
ncbi:MAG: acyl-CoA dehydrogenase C-terminal domain-containing protein [Pikeienuella sp.]